MDKVSKIMLKDLPPFADGTEIEIKPLTIICGLNGVGKTTLCEYIMKNTKQDGLLGEKRLRELIRNFICPLKDSSGNFSIDFTGNNIADSPDIAKKHWYSYFGIPFDWDKNVGVNGTFKIGLAIHECLSTKIGNTTYFMNPEIYLHPANQLKMADLLLATAISGRNVIVETHSDHIINRIVRRVMESYGAEHDLFNLVKIYFIFKDENNYSDIYINIKIDPYKGLVDCPPEIFDQYGYELRDIMKQAYTNLKKDKR